MARHLWSVLCDQSVVDKDDNQVSLISVTERLTFHQTPEEYEQLDEALQEAQGQDKGVLVPVNLHLVSMWIRSDPEVSESVPLRYRVTASDGWRFPDVEGEIDLQSSDGFRARWKLTTFLFRGFGRYWISIQHKPGKAWQTAARIPLEVVKGSPRTPRS